MLCNKKSGSNQALRHTGDNAVRTLLEEEGTVQIVNYPFQTLFTYLEESNPAKIVLDGTGIDFDVSITACLYLQDLAKMNAELKK